MHSLVYSRTHNVPRDISETRETKQVSQRTCLSTMIAAHIVKAMLMRRSQLQPVINAAAAGGKMIAT